MKRLISALATAAFASSCISAATAARIPYHHGRSADSGWVATMTDGLVLQQATDLGPIAGSTPLHIVVGMHGNLAGAEAYAAQVYTPGSSLYHHFLTPSKFTAMFSPTRTQVNAVANYLSSNGMQNIYIHPNRALVEADTNAGAAEQAFNTQIHQFTQLGQTVYANVTPAYVPAPLSNSVVAVLGLSNLRMHLDYLQTTLSAEAALGIDTILTPVKSESYARYRKGSGSTSGGPPPLCNDVQWYADAIVYGESGQTLPNLPVPNAPLPVCYPAAYTPNAYRLAYDDQGNPIANKTTFADFTEGAVTGAGSLATVISDLGVMESENGIKPVNTQIVQIGAVGTDTSGQDEWDVDSQAAVGIGGGAREYVFYNMSDLSLTSFAPAVNTFAEQNKVKIANASFGACEVEWYATGEMPVTDYALVETALQGQTVTVASGDTGSFCPALGVGENGAPAGAPNLDYPATSPYVLAVGGTSLLSNATTGQYDSEISWYSGDGGLSYLEEQSPWQNAMVAAVGGGQGVTAGPRMVPDMAMSADLLTGMYTIISGSPAVVGGTSLAAPLAEGVYARVLGAHQNKLGMAAAALYPNYVNNGGGVGDTPQPNGVTPARVGGFHDIFAGANGYYTAGPGFDLNTGMGSFDINALFASFS